MKLTNAQKEKFLWFIQRQLETETHEWDASCEMVDYLDNTLEGQERFDLIDELFQSIRTTITID